MSCITDNIHRFQATLKDPSRSIEDRRFVLKSLFHRVQDLHMPLHVGENHDKVGNLTQIRFFERGSYLHRLWDSDMIGRVGTTEEFWMVDLERRTLGWRTI